MHPITTPVAWATGIPEPNLRLLFTLLLAYPVAKVYNETYVRPKAGKRGPTEADRNTFILLAGLSLSFFFNLTAIYHSLLTVTVSYAFCYLGNLYGQRQLSCAAVWVFNAAYLLLGYYYTATDDYDISWTMPQCILCLRLMGFGFDFMDGAKPVKVPAPGKPGENEAVRPTEVTKTPAQLPHSFAQDTPLVTLPPFDQVLAYCLFPSAFLIGPQFSFSLYKRWLEAPYFGHTITNWEETQKAQMRYMWRCISLAVVYIAIQQTIGAEYTTAYLLSEGYAALPLWKRLGVFWLAGKLVYNKYLGVWLLTEGASAYFGISYEGEDKDRESHFGGLANMLPAVYERATSIDHVIASFNINTNLWTKYYVFKRLRFLGNKTVSQVAALAFLAIWHGFHINYFTTFFLEFAYSWCESVLRQNVVVPHVYPYTQKNELVNAAWKVIAWLVCTSTLNYAVIGFDMLKFSKAWVAYKSVYFVGHVAIAIIFCLHCYWGKVRSKRIHYKAL